MFEITKKNKYTLLILLTIIVVNLFSTTVSAKQKLGNDSERIIANKLYTLVKEGKAVYLYTAEVDGKKYGVIKVSGCYLNPKLELVSLGNPAVPVNNGYYFVDSNVRLVTNETVIKKLSVILHANFLAKIIEKQIANAGYDVLQSSIENNKQILKDLKSYHNLQVYSDYFFKYTGITMGGLIVSLIPGGEKIAGEAALKQAMEDNIDKLFKSPRDLLLITGGVGVQQCINSGERLHLVQESIFQKGHYISNYTDAVNYINNTKVYNKCYLYEEFVEKIGGFYDDNWYSWTTSTQKIFDSLFGTLKNGTSSKLKAVKIPNKWEKRAVAVNVLFDINKGKDVIGTFVEWFFPYNKEVKKYCTDIQGIDNYYIYMLTPDPRQSFTYRLRNKINNGKGVAWQYTSATPSSFTTNEDYFNYGMTINQVKNIARNLNYVLIHEPLKQNPKYEIILTFKNKSEGTIDFHFTNGLLASFRETYRYPLNRYQNAIDKYQRLKASLTNIHSSPDKDLVLINGNGNISESYPTMSKSSKDILWKEGRLRILSGWNTEKSRILLLARKYNGSNIELRLNYYDKSKYNDWPDDI